jgi:hypothetical protein
MSVAPDPKLKGLYDSSWNRGMVHELALGLTQAWQTSIDSLSQVLSALDYDAYVGSDVCLPYSLHLASLSGRRGICISQPPRKYLYRGILWVGPRPNEG